MTVTVYQRERRGRRVFVDSDGFLCWPKSEDSTEELVLNWSDQLGSDTISTSTWEAKGVTLSSESNTTTTATVFVTGASGRVTNTIVTAAGETLVRRIRIMARDDDQVRRGYR